MVGPPVRDLRSASVSARAALAGLRAAPAWPDAPRPASADELLPERALDGDAGAVEALVETVYEPLLAGGTALLDTLTTYLEQGSSLEGTARMLFVHPNTVRYRLRRVTELTGFTPSVGRDGHTLWTAIIPAGRRGGAGQRPSSKVAAANGPWLRPVRLALPGQVAGDELAPATQSRAFTGRATRRPPPRRGGRRGPAGRPCAPEHQPARPASRLAVADGGDEAGHGPAGVGGVEQEALGARGQPDRGGGGRGQAGRSRDRPGRRAAAASAGPTGSAVTAVARAATDLGRGGDGAGVHAEDAPGAEPGRPARRSVRPEPRRDDRAASRAARRPAGRPARRTAGPATGGAARGRRRRRRGRRRGCCRRRG